MGMRIKRFHVFSSKSSGGVSATSHQSEVAHANNAEPSAKKQRQSTGSGIKQSVRRLIGSVKKLLPSRRKDKQDAVPSAAQPEPEIVKNAAMKEAEMFLARLGDNWTIEQLEARIAYLYRLVDDAFERAYQNCLKTGAEPESNATASDYMKEIRGLQKMVKDRKPQEQTQVSQTETNVAAVVEEIVIEEAVAVVEEPQMYTPTIPVVVEQQAMPIIDMAEGILYNGVVNDVYLDNYRLSGSKIAEEQHVVEQEHIYLPQIVEEVQIVQTEQAYLPQIFEVAHIEQNVEQCFVSQECYFVQKHAPAQQAELGIENQFAAWEINDVTMEDAEIIEQEQEQKASEEINDKSQEHSSPEAIESEIIEEQNSQNQSAENRDFSSQDILAAACAALCSSNPSAQSSQDILAAACQAISTSCHGSQDILAAACQALCSSSQESLNVSVSAIVLGFESRTSSPSIPDSPLAQKNSWHHIPRSLSAHDLEKARQYKSMGNITSEFKKPEKPAQHLGLEGETTVQVGQPGYVKSVASWFSNVASAHN